MADFIELSSDNFPSLQNLESGLELDIIAKVKIVDVKPNSVVVNIEKLEGKPGFIGRFEKMAKIVERAVDKDGRLKVTTQQSHLGNT